MIDNMKKHKLISLYVGIVILSLLFIISTMLIISPIGIIGYLQFAISAIALLMIGVPLFLFMGYLTIIFLIGVIKDIPTGMMKKQKKLTKQGKKDLKDGLFVVGIYGFAMLIGFGISWFGVDFAASSIEDYQYMDNPEMIVLNNWYIEKRSGFSVSRRVNFIGSYYRLYGNDLENNEYDFLVGKYPYDMITTDDDTEILKVYYLPNSKVVIKIE